MQVFPQVGTFVSRVDPDRVARRAVPPRGRRARRAGRRAAPSSTRTSSPSCGPTSTSSGHRASTWRSSSTSTRRSTTACCSSAGTSGRGRPSSSAKGHLDRARRLGLKETSPASFADQHVEIFQAVVDGDLPRARAHDALAPAGGLRGHRAHPAALTGAVRRGRRLGAGPAQRRRLGVTTAAWLRRSVTGVLNGDHADSAARTRTGFLVCRRVIDECRRTTTGCPGSAARLTPILPSAPSGSFDRTAPAAFRHRHRSSRVPRCASTPPDATARPHPKEIPCAAHSSPPPQLCSPRSRSSAAAATPPTPTPSVSAPKAPTARSATRAPTASSPGTTSRSPRPSAPSSARRSSSSRPPGTRSSRAWRPSGST